MGFYVDLGESAPANHDPQVQVLSLVHNVNQTTLTGIPADVARKISKDEKQTYAPNGEVSYTPQPPNPKP